MNVIKRNGTRQEVKFDKITERIKKLSNGLDVNVIKIAQNVCAGLKNDITTKELDELACQTAMGMSLTHPDYMTLAARIGISNLHKETPKTFSEAMEKLYKNIDYQKTKRSLISEELYSIVQKHKKKLNDMIDNNRDYNIDYFGLMTLKRAYLMKANTFTNNTLRSFIIERPQYTFLRVAIGIHGDDLVNIERTYMMLSFKDAIHATPTLFHAGTPRPQMSSCYLLQLKDDSVDGIYKTITDCAKISKYAGGIGVAIHNVRGKGSYIRGTNGFSNGLMPMLKVFDTTSRYIDQGGGKRNGSFAVYLEPWHTDVYDFLEAKRNQGAEQQRARNLFYALWIPDLFMKRVKENGNWTLMCPDKCPNLWKVYGEEFEKLYTSYEQKKMGKTIKARDLWNTIIDSQIETGLPYMVYKDAVNRKSNQKNVGIIKSSNLCTEIVEYTDENESAVCNLASLGLPNFVDPVEIHSLVIYGIPGCKGCTLAKEFLKRQNIPYTYLNAVDHYAYLKRYSSKLFPLIELNNVFIGGYRELIEVVRPMFNYKRLFETTRLLTYNLNKIIDRNFYPTPETKTSNLRHRPIGIGVQGLADVFIKMNYRYDSPEARELNKNIFETIYFAALTKSCEIAKIDGPYSTFEGSPLSEGKFQFDLWNETNAKPFKVSNRYDWGLLRKEINKYGVRNSLLIAPMPTASTSQILGNNECFEPYTSNVYLRRTLAGEFIVINKHLIKMLNRIGLWNELMKQKIMYYKGSVQYIPEIPKDIRDLFKTSWELKQKVLIDLAIDRGHYICQSQSLNIFAENPTYDLLTKIHFYGWKNGLKTGSYYIRSKAASHFQRFTIDPNLEKQFKQEQRRIITENEKKECISCSG